MVRRVPGEHVAQAGLHAHPDEGEDPALLPLGIVVELFLTEHATGFVVRIRGVGGRQVHGHVDVVALRLVRGLEDLRVEPRVARVDHDIGLDAPDEVHQVLHVGGIDQLCGELPRVIEGPDGRFRRLLRDVRENEGVEEPPRLGNGGHGSPDSACTHHEDVHFSAHSDASSGASRHSLRVRLYAAARGRTAPGQPRLMSGSMKMYRAWGTAARMFSSAVSIAWLTWPAGRDGSKMAFAATRITSGPTCWVCM